MEIGRDREGERLWSAVIATVRPLSGRVAPKLDPAEPTTFDPDLRRAPTMPEAPALTPKLRSRCAHGPPPEEIEPNRRRLILRREAVMPRIDLHGLTQHGARAALAAFILRAAADGARAVLVITGKGALGDGVLRRRTPDWLAEPPLRGLVAGVSEADRRHGGAGALYVALKRSSRP